MVEMERIELSIRACKAHVFPLALHPLIVVWEARIELAPRVSKTRRLPLSYTQIVLVPSERFELPTLCLQSICTTTVLKGLKLVRRVGIEPTCLRPEIYSLLSHRWNIRRIDL